ncbi:MAG: integrase core domain-containing protein [Filomicrobium sp.]
MPAVTAALLGRDGSSSGACNIKPALKTIPARGSASRLRVCIDQARVVINQWLRQYNHTRPHQALSMRPPVPETLRRSGP